MTDRGPGSELRDALPDLAPVRLEGAVWRGLRGLCPACGRGALFDGFLRVRPACPACGFDLSSADAGDGPAVFVVMIAGTIVCFAALIVEVAYRPPIWVHFAIWLPLATALCLGLLRPFKGVLVALQFHNHAAQAGGADLRG